MKRTTIFVLAVLLTASSFAQVGIGTTSPNTTLDVRGSFAANSRSFSTTSETVLNTDYTLLFTGSSACTLTLPDATTCIGRIIHVKNTKTGTVPILTVGTTVGQTIDGSSTWLLDSSNESVNVVSNGSNWLVMGQSMPYGSATPWMQGGNAVASLKTIGTTTNYDLPFITNNSERMRLTGTGLGIGIVSPTEKLQVDGNIRLSGTDRGIFFDATSDPYAGIKTVTRPNETTELMLFAGNDVSGSYGADRIRLASHEIHFATSSSGGSTNSGDPTAYYSDETNVPTRMMIDENGNVGVGTSDFDPTDPEKFLIDAGNTSSRNLMSGYGTINNYLQVQIANLSSGTNASTDFVAANDASTTQSNYIDLGINSSSYTNSKSNILNGQNTAYLYAVGQNFLIGNGTPAKDLLFFTNPLGGSLGTNTANGIERMRVTSGGTVSINSSSPNTSYKFYVNGDCYSTGSWWQPSDRRLKTNIHNLGYGLKEVMALQPVGYNWIDPTASKENQLGLIAQDMQKIIPEAVHGDEQKETLSVNYTELVPVLINAIKEQQKEIDELKQRVKALEHK